MRWREAARARERRRRQVVSGTGVVGTALLGRSLSTPPGSPEFYASTATVAALWAGGGLLSGPLRRGSSLRRPVLTPLATGVGAFGVFYGAALVARRIPVLAEAISHVLNFADEGEDRLVLGTTLANGVGEEVFFRGALYDALGEHHPVAVSTALYTASTAATRNPALVLAASVMGTLFGLQRRESGGIQAPLITHLTWSTLMVRFLPPLFRSRVTADQPG
ncbi:MAG TPA: CPBP family intramembrane glutamic endopeptidase [Marmoricola sp.]|nr:CPBP family intramembrane glutamic endopeptidase [Marmoricola sp.]